VIGLRLCHYVILEEIGAGAMGVVMNSTEINWEISVRRRSDYLRRLNESRAIVKMR